MLKHITKIRIRNKFKQLNVSIIERKSNRIKIRPSDLNYVGQKHLVTWTLEGSSGLTTKRVTAEGCAGAPSGFDVVGLVPFRPSLSYLLIFSFSFSIPLSFFVFPSLPFCTHLIIVGVGTSARMYVANRGRRSFKDGARLWRHICFIPPCQHASGLSFNTATVSSRLSRSLYPYRRHPLSPRPHSSAATCQFYYSMFNMSLFYLFSRS